MARRKIAFVLVVWTVCCLNACGASQWDVHAATGTVLRDTVNDAGRSLREHRKEAMRDAARRAQGVEGHVLNDISIAIDRAAEQWDRDFEYLINAQVSAAEATNAYVQTVFRAMRGLSHDDVGPLARAAGRTARALIAAARVTDVLEIEILSDFLDFLDPPAPEPAPEQE